MIFGLDEEPGEPKHPSRLLKQATWKSEKNWPWLPKKEFSDSSLPSIGVPKG